MIKVIHIILTLLIIPITSHSQNYVEAKIVDASNGFNLNKIEISIDGKKTYSDENGNFKYEVIYFYNVYGPKQICKGKMATVIGIFEDCYLKNKPLPVVRPGSQTRRFTHIQDTVEVCYKAWKNNKCKYYSISNKESFSILQVAKLFKSKIKFLERRKGERFASALTSMSLSNKVHKNFGKIKLRKYIENFLQNNRKTNF